MNMHDFTSGARVHNTRGLQALTEDQLRRFAPSIFAESASSDVSSRYLFLPTFEILQRLMAETGLVPVRVQEQNVRDENNRSFARHEIVLRSAEIRDWKVGDTVFEVRLTNSHNRASAYAVDPGLFRFACSNGLLVAQSVLPGIRVRHSGDKEIVGSIIEGTCELIKEAPMLQGRIENMRSNILSLPEQVAFAKAAATIRWVDESPVAPDRLIAPRRMADKENDAWTVMNRVQENIIKGGQVGYKRDSNNRPKRTTTRQIKSITEDQRINKALWTLTEELLKIRAN